MLDRFVRFLQARRALSDGRFEELFRLLEDPLVRDERRAADLRREALDAVTQRAARRLERGDLGAALADLRWVLDREPVHERASALRQEADRALAAAESRRAARSRLLDEVRRTLEHGRLAEAGRLLATATDLDPGPEVAELDALLQQRGAAARSALEEARRGLRQGQAEAAARLLERARSLDRELAGLADAEQEVLQARFRDLIGQARELGRSGRPGDGLAILLPHLRSHPALEQEDDVIALRRACAAELQTRIQATLEQRGLEAAELELQAADPLLRAEPEILLLHGHCQQLRRAAEMAAQGEFATANACYQSLFRRTRWPLAEAGAARAVAAERASRQPLAQAQELLARGDLMGARSAFEAVLAQCPEHRLAREQLALLQRTLEQDSQSLTQCRSLVGEGRLLAAREILYRLLAGGPSAEEARAVLRDIELRCRKVEDGVRQIRGAVATRVGPPAPEALQALLDRTQELQSLQSDSAALTELSATLARELRSCQSCQRIRAHAQAGDAAGLLDALREESEGDGEFLRPDRVAEDRSLAADAALDACERLLAAGRLQEADVVSGQVLQLIGAGPSRQRTRGEDLVARVQERQRRSQDLARAGNEALARGDLRAAQDAAFEATILHPRADEVLRLREALARVRASEERAAKAERMLDDKDLAGAHRQLRGMGTTPEPLRTRVFELRRRLDQLDGLKGDFVLRVEEAGEYLVLRGDRVVIGNARHGQCDLPILATLQPRHAEIRRKMSFHGGSSDVLAALTERPVAVDGQPVREHTLRNGQRIRLGDTLEVTYLVPSSKSRSVLLRLERGFQVDGVERVLLMTDRSKDGRIVLANRADAHIRVGPAGVEVELFADGAGALRVRFAGDGEVDGRPFRGESPVPPGAQVRCGPVVFSAHPRPPVTGIETRATPQT